MPDKSYILRFLLTSVVVLLISSLGSAPLLFGQGHSQPELAEMQKLQFLVGEWKGSGLEFNPDGTVRNEFTQKAKVEVKAKGFELRVTDSRTYKKRLYYGMLQTSSLDATISYDQVRELYRWRGYASKNALEAKLIADKTLQYGMPFSITVIPADGNRRHTIRVMENGDWHETLDVWVNVGWVKSEESTLKKVK